ncbi:L-fuculokinase [Spongisporangium articulatum]|uniref:L-fuculokinase n=1 Tax=Spongisporangium articulatum TaxID=3362603 RepID=A0ABW8AM30_9ACTN
MSLVGLDLGTSGVRAAAFDVAGRPLAEVARATTLRRPGPGLAELDAEELLAAAVAVLREVAESPAVRADPVEALSFSVLGEAVVGVDDEGRALGPAPVSMDRRGADLAMAVDRELGADEVQRITGQPLHAMFSVYKVGTVAQWVDAGVRVRTMGEFVAARLGARAAIDTTMAARTGAFDVESGTWSAEMADATGVPVTIWPDVVPAGTTIGAVGTEASGATGLRPGTPIVAGSHDQACSYWGAGGRVGATSVFAFGSSDCLTVGSPTRPEGLIGTGLATYAAAQNLWITLAGTAAGGWALEWWSRTAGASDAAATAALLEDAHDVPPALLVLPYLAGSGTLDNDEAAAGAVLGLTLETSRAELTRAFLEGAGYELARIDEALRARGVEVGAIRAVGTGSQFPLALRMRASAAGLALHAVPGNSSARGAALQAGVGIGLFGSLADLPEPVLGDGGPAVPEDQDWYAAQRRRYTDLAKTIAPLSHGLTAGRHTTEEKR